MSNLVLILEDQLSHSISSLNNYDSSQDVVFMCEVSDRVTRVKHHKKKIAFLFSAMRHFAKELREKDYKVDFTKLVFDRNPYLWRVVFKFIVNIWEK